MRYAEIAVNAPVTGTFHYHIPPELDGVLQPGHLVRVSFGTAMQPGIVLAITAETPVQQTKPVIETLDPQPVVNAVQIDVARWMSRAYLAPLGLCLWLWLPPGMTGHHEALVTLLDDSAAPADTTQAKLVDALRRRGPLRGAQLRQVAGRANWEKAVAALVTAGAVQRESILSPPRVRPQMVSVAALAIHPDRIPDTLRHLGKSNRAADLLEIVARLTDDNDEPPLVAEVLAQPGIGRATLNRLLETGLISIDSDDCVLLDVQPDALDRAIFELRGGELDLRILQMLARENGPVDVSWVYAQTGATLADLKRLAARELVDLGERRAWRDSLADRDFVPLSAPRLTADQRRVWQTVRMALDGESVTLHGESATASPHTFLLHGVTGSGKTEIYLRAIERVLAQGRQAIFLVPEIALTAQTVRRVAARFPGRVAVVHGDLSDGERYDTWQRARAGEIDVVVGARSALFTPLPDPGLIVLDEEHDASYKQSPPVLPPYYHARQVAEALVERRASTLILGSATPDVETAYRASRGEIATLSLPGRIMGHRIRIAEQSARAGVQPRYTVEPGHNADALTIPLPQVELVDMRAELKAGNRGMFSRALLDALGETLTRGEQAILFLNRRGMSTYVFCRDCGYVAACPRCDMPLIYHERGGGLRCHHCGYQTGAPSVCPACGSDRIRFFGAGTQHVEAALRDAFPDARSLRWDADTATRHSDHDLILQRFAGQQADVLIGTQMIAKGLDLPLVTLVGVVSADVGLNLPDFRAGERTFQVLAQVAGRAGRGVLGGRVVLQTYQPDHYIIQAAASHDYATVYEREIAARREFGYPPFRRLLRVLIQHENNSRAHAEAQRAADTLRQRLQTLDMTGTRVIGPAPCFFSRVNRLYRWHVILRGPDLSPLRDFDLPRHWIVEVDPVDLL